MADLADLPRLALALARDGGTASEATARLARLGARDAIAVVPTDQCAA